MMDLETGGTWKNIRCDTYQSAHPFVCEVDALNTGYTKVSQPINLVGKSVYYRSIYSGYPSTGANDGYFDSSFSVRKGFYTSYSGTSTSYYDYWRVSLGTYKLVSEVWVYTRSDSGE
jgi:hypothetical protein